MNIIKNFIRHFRANKKSDIINMLSLIPGLACCLLILAWVILEVQTDRSFPKIDRIVVVQGYHEGERNFWGASPAVATAVKEEYPEVEDAVRINIAGLVVKHEQEAFNITSFDADASLFSLFDLTFLEGEAFQEGETNKCVLTRRVAQNLFGGESAIGKFLDFEFGNFVVCGVIENLPKNSTVARNGNISGLSIILPMNRRNSEQLASWYNNSYETYVLLKDKNLFDAFKDKVKNRAMEAQPQNQLYLSANLLKDRYLYFLGNIKNVRVMAIIAIIILLVAGINFINLATAGFSASSFQTGIRKVMGATKGMLVIRYFTNTFILVLLSFVIAVMLAVVTLPFFNTIIGGNFAVSDLFSPFAILISVLIIFITAVLAGLYPAFYISSFEPAKVLKGKSVAEGKNAVLRHMLVVLQFAVAATLIISTTVIMKQIRMYHKMDLGYEWNEVIYVSLRNQAQKQKATVLKEEFLQNPQIKSVSLSLGSPFFINWNGPGWEWEGKDPVLNPLITFSYVDADWVKVYDIKLKEGEFFSERSEGILINREMVELMGGGDVTGKFITRGEEVMKITGVIDKMLYNNFKLEPSPLVIRPLTAEDMGVVEVVNIRVEKQNLSEVYEFVKQKSADIFGEEPVVRFLNHNVEYILHSENQTSKMVSFFSALAIIISCLGLFGLAKFIIERKRKEIGIRRVSGAKVSEIVWLLNVNFIRPVLVGFLLACPIAYFLMKSWLADYMTKTALSWWIFATSGIIIILITVLTLVWRSTAAAMENPVNSLKSE